MAKQAARLGDPIGHAYEFVGMLAGAALGGLIVGALAVKAVVAALPVVAAAALASQLAVFAVFGVAIAAVGTVVGIGLLAAMIAAAIGATAEGAGVGSRLGLAVAEMSFMPRVPTGRIVDGSANVWTEGRQAARERRDAAFCGRHKPYRFQIDQGSSTVSINGHPASRVNDRIVCGAFIIDGATNVFIGDQVTNPDNDYEKYLDEDAKTLVKVLETVELLEWANPFKALIGEGVEAILDERAKDWAQRLARSLDLEPGGDAYNLFKAIAEESIELFGKKIGDKLI